MLCDFSTCSPVDCTPAWRPRVSRAQPASAFILPGSGNSSQALLPSPGAQPHPCLPGWRCGMSETEAPHSVHTWAPSAAASAPPHWSGDGDVALATHKSISYTVWEMEQEAWITTGTICTLGMDLGRVQQSFYWNIPWKTHKGGPRVWFLAIAPIPLVGLVSKEMLLPQARRR